MPFLTHNFYIGQWGHNFFGNYVDREYMCFGREETFIFHMQERKNFVVKITTTFLQQWKNRHSEGVSVGLILQWWFF